MRFLRSAILAIGVVGMFAACGGSQGDDTTTPAANPCGTTEANPCAANPCAGGEAANPCAGGEANPCGGENPCGAGEGEGGDW